MPSFNMKWSNILSISSHLHLSKKFVCSRFLLFSRKWTQTKDSKHSPRSTIFVGKHSFISIAEPMHSFRAIVIRDALHNNIASKVNFLRNIFIKVSIRSSWSTFEGFLDINGSFATYSTMHHFISTHLLTRKTILIKLPHFPQISCKFCSAFIYHQDDMMSISLSKHPSELSQQYRVFERRFTDVDLDHILAVLC